MNRRDFMFGAGFGAVGLAASTPALAKAETAGARGDSRFNVRDFGAKGDGVRHRSDPARDRRRGRGAGHGVVPRRNLPLP